MKTDPFLNLWNHIQGRFSFSCWTISVKGHQSIWRLVLSSQLAVALMSTAAASILITTDSPAFCYLCPLILHYTDGRAVSMVTFPSKLPPPGFSRPLALTAPWTNCRPPDCLFLPGGGKRCGLRLIDGLVCCMTAESAHSRPDPRRRWWNARLHGCLDSLESTK